MKRWLACAASAITTVCVSLVSTACTGARGYPPVGPMPVGPQDGPFTSNGQRIYYTATSSSGQPIVPQGFVMMMHRIACVDCHGPEGKGGTVYMMMRSFDVPNITWPVLTAPYEDHAPYTEETVKRAITQGLDPAGKQLEEFMPRWQISAQDLNDLLSFLETQR